MSPDKAKVLVVQSIKHPRWLLTPRQRGDEAEVVEADLAWLSAHDQPLEHLRHKLRQAQQATDLAVGEARLGGEIGYGDDFDALDPLSPSQSA